MMRHIRKSIIWAGIVMLAVVAPPTLAARPVTDGPRPKSPRTLISVGAQEVVEIDDDVACPSCLVESGPSVTLVAPGDSVWFSSWSGLRVARDGEGNYIAAPMRGRGLIGVFGPDGGYRSAYGRVGRGPGEFTTDMPLLIELGDGDVLYVIDPVNLHTLAPRAEASLDQVRMPVEVMGDAVVLRSGIAVESTVRTEAGMTTIQLLRPDGTNARSIGAIEEAEFSRRYALGRSNDGMDVWSAPSDRFHITRYGPDGETKTRIERTSRLFRPRPGSTPGAPFLAPANTAVTSIVQDGDGLLWIAISHAPPSFSPVAPIVQPRYPGEEAGIILPTNLNRYLHTTIEVLDLETGTVLARRGFEEYVTFVRTGDHDVLVFSLRVDELGGLDCVVTPLVLRRG